MPEVAEWKFERGGWLQICQLPERAGSFTHAVSRIEEPVTLLDEVGGRWTQIARVSFRPR